MCDHCGCREYAPIAELSEEHEAILGLAWQLAESADRADRARIAGELGPLLDRHVVTEEEGLYPLLLATGDIDGDSVDVLESEHLAIGAALRDGTFDRRAFYALAAHIEEEEMRLFPAAMFGFDDEAWDVLARMLAAAVQPGRTAAGSGPKALSAGSRTADYLQ